MLFKIKAKKENGEIVEGVREASDRFSLSRNLRTEGLQIFFAEQLAQKSKTPFSIFTARVSLKEKIIFASNLSSMIKAGLTLSRALEVLERQTEHKYFKGVIGTLLRKINTGESFSQALGGFPNIFPPVFLAMVAAGEESGKLTQSLNLVKDQMNKTFELKRKIIGALIYPTIIICLIVVIGILMMTFMVPTLSATFKDLNMQLPLSTRMIIVSSDFMSQHFLLVVLVLIVAIGSMGSWLKSKPGRAFTDRIVIRLPVFSNLVKEYNSAVIMRTISSLISAGVSVTESLSITGRIVQNSLYKPLMKKAEEQVPKGVLLSAIFSSETKLFPVLVSELSEVGEETGDLPKLLEEGALFYEGEIDQVTKNLSTIVEPLLMIVIGTAVGFFVYAMIGPMYSLTSAIK